MSNLFRLVLTILKPYKTTRRMVVIMHLYLMLYTSIIGLYHTIDNIYSEYFYLLLYIPYIPLIGACMVLCKNKVIRYYKSILLANHTRMVYVWSTYGLDQTQREPSIHSIHQYHQNMGAL